MTTQISTVRKAQGDWQTPLNETINAVNGLVGGAEPTHLANPLAFTNGYTGNSDAYTIQSGNFIIVILAIYNLDTSKGTTGDWAAVAQIPDNIKPVDNEQLRIPVSQEVVLAQHGQDLVIWKAKDAYLEAKFSGVCVYLTKNE